MNRSSPHKQTVAYAELFHNTARNDVDKGSSIQSVVITNFLVENCYSRRGLSTALYIKADQYMGCFLSHGICLWLCLSVVMSVSQEKKSNYHRSNQDNFLLFCKLLWTIFSIYIYFFFWPKKKKTVTSGRPNF